MRPSLVVLVMLVPCAQAQQQDIQQQLILRQQQSDAFTLQLRQSQEMLNVPSGRRADVERRPLTVPAGGIVPPAEPAAAPR